MGPLSLLLSLLRCIYHLPSGHFSTWHVQELSHHTAVIYKLCDVIPCNSLYSPFHFSSFFFFFPLKKKNIYFWLCWVFIAVHRLSLVVVCGLCCPTACGIFPDQGSNLCLLHVSQILNHWITREVILGFFSRPLCFRYTEFPQVLVFMIFSQTEKPLSPLGC